MKDRTIDHRRPDAGEANKDINSKPPKTEAAYEQTELSDKVTPEVQMKVADVLKELKAAVMCGSAVGKTIALFADIDFN